MVIRIDEPFRIVRSLEEAKYWGRENKPDLHWPISAEEGIPRFHNVFSKRRDIAIITVAGSVDEAREKSISVLEGETERRGYDCAEPRGF